MSSTTVVSAADLDRIWPWALGAVLLVALGFAWMFAPAEEWLRIFTEWIGSLGAAGVVLFALGYVAATLLLVPGALVTIAAAVAFGWWAVPLVLLAAGTGAMLAFLVSRHLLRGRVRAIMEQRPKLKAGAEAIEDEGFKVLLLLRLSPVIPFNVQSYLLGATHIPFGTYAAATAIGMVPGTLLNVYIGVLGEAAATGAAGPASLALLVAGLIATATVAILVGIKARRRLQGAGLAR